MSTKLPLAAKWRMPEKNTGNKSSPKSFEEEKTENEEEPVEEVKEKVEDEIEILSIDDEDDEEEDEILNALDRYFEAPEPSDEEKKESDT